MSRKLLILVSLIVALRILLLHQAVRCMPDEYFYNYSLFALLKLREWNIQDFLRDLFSATRPGYNVISLLPAFLQTLLFQFFSLDPRSSISLLMPLLFNGCVNVVLLVLYYRIIDMYVSDKKLAAICLITYALLVNSTLYTTHLVAYDYALCIIVWLLYRFLRMHQYNTIPGNKDTILYGTALAWSFLIYPGYYLVIPFFFLSIFILFRSAGTKRRVSSALLFSSAFLVQLLLFQVLSIVGGTNYYIKCTRLSKTILQGSFEEGFNFIIKYFSEVEHFPFVVIAVALSIYLVKELIAVAAHRHLWQRGLFLLFVYCLCIYLYNAANIYFFHKQVNYGRLLHLYYPVIFLCLFVAISTMGKPYGFILSVIILAGVSFNLFLFYYRANAAAFPLSLIEKEKIDVNNAQQVFTHLSPIPYSSYDTTARQQDYTLMNFAYFSDIQFIGPVGSRYNDTLAFGPHFLNMKAYQYEGLSIRERNILDRHPIYTGVFRK